MTEPRKPATPDRTVPGDHPTCETSAEGTGPDRKVPYAEPLDLGFLAPPLQAGELGRLGGYRVLEVLGSGGMGLVFRAEDPNLKRLVAIKVMRPEVAANPVAADRFLREARATAAVKHDHIVTIYQVGQDRGVPFIAMEFLRGEPLDARSNRLGRLVPFEVTRVGYQTALGLAAAHDAGLVHRDVKPANVWLEGPEGRVKLLDFGLARQAREDASLTTVGAILGTPAYMSPEQANGKPLDARSDLFSLGVMLYRIATGVLPFQGDSAIAVMVAIGSVTPPPPRSLVPEIPAALDDIIVRLLAKNPADRPQTAREVADALAPVANTVTVVRFVTASSPEPAHDPTFVFDAHASAPEPPPRPHAAPRPEPSPRRTPRLAVAATILFAAAAVAGVVWFLTRQGRDTTPTAATTPDRPTPVHVPKPVPRPKWTPPPGFDDWSFADQFAEVKGALAALNPKWAGSAEMTEGERLVRVNSAGLADPSPLAALKWVKHLDLRASIQEKPNSVSDLSWLSEMKLVSLNIANTRVKDLSPLKGMRLRFIGLENSDVADLSPLKGMPLARVSLDRVHNGLDLAPIADAPLVEIDVGSFEPADWAPLARQRPQLVRGISAERAGIRAIFPAGFRQIEFIGDKPAGEFWKDGTFAPEPPAPDPAWVAEVSKLKGDALRDKVIEALKQRNKEWEPKYFDGQPDADKNIVGIGLYTAGLRDATPLRAFTALKKLELNRLQTGVGPMLTNLEPLRGLELEEFRSHYHWFLDLAVLRDMPLKRVSFGVGGFKPWYAPDLRAMLHTLEKIDGVDAREFLARQK